MENVIKLKLSTGVLTNKEPFIVCDNEDLTLVFDTDIALTDCVVKCANGNTALTYKLKDLKSFTVPKELLHGGELFVNLTLLAGRKAVRVWNVAPITIVEVNTGFECYDAVTALQSKVAELTARLAEAENKETVLSSEVKSNTLKINACVKAVNDLSALA